MYLDLWEKGLEYAKRKKKWVPKKLVPVGLTGYSLYKIYNLPCVIRKRQRLSKFLGALVAVAEMMSDSADAIGILSEDLKEFLGSDSNQIPQILKQISKISKSDEFSEVIDKLFSDAGSGFASVVVGSFARNVVMALYSEWQQNNLNSKSNEHVSRWVEVVCEDKCRELIGDCIQLFVSTAVAVYLDKTTNINTFDEIFSGLTNPKHEARVKDMLVSVCCGTAESLIQTSHNVWTTNSVPVLKSKSTYSKIDFEESFIPMKKLMDKNQESRWVRKMSLTLAVPNNRKLVLDMTGTVTFETRSTDVVHQEVVDRGVEASRFVSVKSSAVATLCLNILNSPWILAPH
ncbi:hypothetical protein CDL12_10415 [Handroanthus impetiginosus]|uniref:Uncharacterized protein n=1 Tax=Handroanthus impetiginosus TaxID=429701 RepID=A0A2G9HHZ7_9LAMI|nr:hypothetical protein CDL12_10415 [Handroanthus impetiginosus]